MNSIGKNCTVGNLFSDTINIKSPDTVQASDWILAYDPNTGTVSQVQNNQPSGGSYGITLYLNNGSYPSNNTGYDPSGKLLLSPANTTTPQTNITYSLSGASDNAAHLFGTFETINPLISTNLIIPAGIWDFSFYTQVNQTAQQIFIWTKIYYVNSGTAYLMADGTNNKTSLSVSTNINLVDMQVYVPTTPVISINDTIRIEVYIQQPSGNTTGHTIAMFFNDSTISHTTTTILQGTVQSVDTTQLTGVLNHYPTFVRNSATTSAQTLYTDPDIYFSPSDNRLVVPNITSTLTGTATSTTQINLTNDTTSSGNYPLIYSKATSSIQNLYTDDTGLSYNPNTNELTATSFNGTATNINFNTTPVGISYLTTSNGTTGSNVIYPTPIYYTPSNGSITATQFNGYLNGSANSANTANIASSVSLTNDNTAGSYSIPFVKVSTGNQPLYTDTTGLFYNPSTNNLSTSLFTGNLTGTASNATNATYAITANTANTATYATSAGSAGSADSMLSIATNTGTYGRYYFMNMCAQPIGSASYRFVNTLVYFDNDTTTLYCNNLNGTALNSTNLNLTVDNTSSGAYYIAYSKGASGNQALYTDSTLRYNPSTDTLQATRFQGIADQAQQIQMFPTAAATYYPVFQTNATPVNGYEYTYSTSNISLSSTGVFGIQGSTNALRLYDRNTPSVDYWDMYVTTTGFLYFNTPAGVQLPEVFFSPNGAITTQGSSAGYAMRSRTDNTNTWQTYAIGTTGSSTFYWNSTQSGNQTYLQDTGMLHLDGTNAMLRLADQATSGAYQIYFSSGALNFRNNALTNPAMTLNGYGWMNLQGTQAQLRLYSITAGSADFYSFQTAGTTGNGTFGIYHYDGTTTSAYLTFDNTGIANFSSTVSAGQLDGTYGITLPISAVTGTRVGGTVTFDNSKVPNVNSSLGRFKFTMAANITAFVFTAFRAYGSYKIYITGHSTTAYTIAGTGLGTNIRTNWTTATSIPANASALINCDYDGTYWLLTLTVYA